MMTVLTRIGNSQGIRIPKALIQQAHLENAEIELEVVKNGLLIKPTQNLPRVGWEENIKQVLAKNRDKVDEGVLNDLLDDSDLDDWTW